MSIHGSSQKPSGSTSQLLLIASIALCCLCLIFVYWNSLAALAEALSRGLKLELLYITQYAGDSQGIYVRPGSNVINPFDLVNKTIGVPFGSTIHYQVLFLLDLLSLTGSVHLLDLSPAEIINAWDTGQIDVGACWVLLAIIC